MPGEFSGEFKSWLRKFPHRYAVTSGENLKDLKQVAGHFQKLSKLASELSPKTMTVVAVGGGSVGDFAGFFASVFKRGVRLVHVPSTWLAAVDSSHGGKTALNISGVKNQIGTFYPADKVLLVRSLLMGQPEIRVKDAMGELAKIALIDGGPWVRRLKRNSLVGSDLLWNFLKPAIQAKMKIVDQDPREKTGIRQVLNLGHTVGHVFETAYGWPHGQAVSQGLFFALEYSVADGALKSRDALEIYDLLEKKFSLAREWPHRPLSARRFSDLLLQDKKRSNGNQITFIFLSRIGKPMRRSVTVSNILREARRQGVVAK
jgi:3-dehydroquinate synthase